MTGTYYYNYKGRYSIVLLAICNSNYCFTLFNLGHYGSNNDSEVLAKSKIIKTIGARELEISAPFTYMTCDFDPLPYFLVGDGIFPMKTWLMRPYPGKLTKNNEFSIIVCPGLVELLRMYLEYSARAGECFTRQ